MNSEQRSANSIHAVGAREHDPVNGLAGDAPLSPSQHSCEDLLYFAYPKFGFSHYLVTANADGSIPLNAKEGEQISKACVAQANLASELLAALKELCECHRDGGFVEPNEDVLTAARAAIAKAKEIHNVPF